MKNKIIVLLSFIYFLQPVHAQTRVQNDQLKKTWIKKNTNPVLSIDPSIDDFSDLDFFKEVLKDKQVLVLGEPSHGDGEVFLAKSRLIKFLHQEMGFDVLIFESGLFDVQYALSGAKTPNEVLSAIHKSIFRVWSKSEQASPTFNYVSKTYNTERPLVIEGMDIQFNGTDSIFSRTFEDKLKELKILEEEELLFFTDHLKKLLRNHLYTPSVTIQTEFLKICEKLKKKLSASFNGHDGKIEMIDTNFWFQMIKNIEALALTPWNEDLGFRERLMADNLIWLSENKYPNKKIIVWVASVYSFRNRNNINTMNPNLVYDSKSSMGDIVSQHFGDKSYTIGFTAYSGEYGAFYWDSEPKKINKPSQGSLEEYFNSAGHDFSFLDLKELKNSELWINEDIISRSLGYSEMKAEWPNIFDGIFFIKEMKPSTKLLSLKE